MNCANERLFSRCDIPLNIWHTLHNGGTNVSNLIKTQKIKVLFLANPRKVKLEMLGVSMMICVYVDSSLVRTWLSIHWLCWCHPPCVLSVVLRLNLACFVRVMWNYVPECNNSWCSMIHCNQSNLSTTHFKMTRFWTSQMKEWVFDPVIMEYMQFAEKRCTIQSEGHATKCTD